MTVKIKWRKLTHKCLLEYLCLVAQSCLTLCHPWTIARQAPLSMEFFRKEYGMGCQSLLQGTFPMQRSNSGLPCCRRILYHLSHRGSPFHSIVTCYKVIHFLFVCFWMCLVFVATHRLSLVVLRRPHIAVAPLVAEHGL